MAAKMLFAGLSHEQCERVAEIIKVYEYPARSIIFEEREYGDTLYVLEEGCVDVRVLLQDEFSETRRECSVGQLEGVEDGSLSEYGDFFGEMCLLDLEPRSATVVTRTRTIVWEINRDDLYWLFGHDKQLQLKMLLTIARVLSRRLNAHAGPHPEEDYDEESWMERET